MLKIIIYDNDGDTDRTLDSLGGTGATTVVVENSPDAIDKEAMEGDHRIVLVTDNRNTFSLDCITQLARAAKEDGVVACPVFMVAGCREEFHPSVLDVIGKEQPFSLSWDPRPAQGDGIRETRCAMGCCTAMTRAWFSRAGGLMGIREPDNRDILMSLATRAMGGRVVVVPTSKVVRRFGGPTRRRGMGVEMLKMAHVCLPHNELQAFLTRWTTVQWLKDNVDGDEMRGWLKTRMERGIR